MAPDLLETGAEPRPPSRARRVLAGLVTAAAVGTTAVAVAAELAPWSPAERDPTGPTPPAAGAEFRGRGHAFQHGFASGLWTVVVEKGRVVQVRAGELTVCLPDAGTRTFSVTAATTVTGSAPGVKSFTVGDRVRVAGERRGTRLVATRVTGLPAPVATGAAP